MKRGWWSGDSKPSSSAARESAAPSSAARTPGPRAVALAAAGLVTLAGAAVFIIGVPGEPRRSGDDGAARQEHGHAATVRTDQAAAAASRRPGRPIRAPLLPRSTSAGSRSPAPGARPPLQQDFNVEYDGRFTFVRLRFDMSMSAGFGINQQGQPPWAHDYPRAERNLAKILDQVSLVAPYLDGSNIFDLGAPELNRYPIAYMSEPGYWTMDDDEARHLREYLLKGGFLIFDDFRGGHWFNFQEQMRRVLPEHRPIEIDVSHPIFNAFFDIQSLDWRTTYGVVGEYYGFFEDNDPTKRMLAIANYNNDIGDYWEWSDQGWLPIELSNEAYKLGVNYVVYAMTH